MKGVLLLNLGTPNTPHTADVRRYLREFLSDPQVIDINPVARWLLVNLVIAPFRSPKSSKAYKKIWTMAGSPLLVYSQRLATRVANQLGPDYTVELAMRYGNPRVADALKAIRKLAPTELIVLPLYPQETQSSTGTSYDHVRKLVKELGGLPEPQFVKPFFNDEGFLKAFESRIRETLATFEADYVLFSYHGLPERHIRKADGKNHCLASPDCCESFGEINAHCYRAQCAWLTRTLGERLGLPKNGFGYSFQSRLGRTKWIEPYTDVALPVLAKEGRKKVAVACPAFVADCLETLEEIGIRGKEQFIAAGGEDLKLVPSLNESPEWVRAVCEMVRCA